MHPNKKTKTKLHERNKHRSQYDFPTLIKSHPELAPFVSKNKFGDLSIDFFNPSAVKNLNAALLKHFYKIEHWDIPNNYLCPPIPGRADYIHYMADLLKGNNKNKIPKGYKIKCLDIGVGANCIYPIIGSKEYGWTFVGSDVDPIAVASAQKNALSNLLLKKQIEIRLQKNKDHIFSGIIQEREYFDLTFCNPPFHASAKDAAKAASRKLNNLKGQKQKTILNFGGQNNELWCEGGEQAFIKKIILESQQLATSCLWYSSLVSKESNLDAIYKTLSNINATEVKTIAMGQGNKISRIVAWSFLSKKQQKIWAETRWR